MGKFQDLKVWERAKNLAIFIYSQTKQGAFSIASNIAEGDELDTDKQAVRFFYIAKGSSAEVLTQAIIALEIGYWDKDIFAYVEKECKGVSGMLTRLIQTRSVF